MRIPLTENQLQARLGTGNNNLHVRYESTFLLEDAICDVYFENTEATVIEFFRSFFRDRSIKTKQQVIDAILNRPFYPQLLYISEVKYKRKSLVIWR